MKSFADLVKVKQVVATPVKATEKRGITNERQSIIKQFLDRLNADRIGKKHPKTGKELKPITPAFVSSRMAKVGVRDNQQLYWFLGFCNDAQNFSSCWWYWTKTENVDKSV